MFLLLVSFVAGILTILAPCVLPVLPVIIGGTLQNGTKRNPYLITASLAGSIVVFTLLLKFSTLFINIPQGVWSTISGVVIISLGLASLFPMQWQKLSLKLGFGQKSDELLHDSAQVNSHWGDILIGMALGPVFSSCSPTYFLILATVLPASFFLGTLYLIAYALGLALALLAVALLGQRFIKKARFAANPTGWFRRGLGILFLVVGLFIISGADKKLQTYLVDQGYGVGGGIEEHLLQQVSTKMPEKSLSTNSFPRYKEIAQPAGYVNSEPFTIGQFIGKKIIMVDFMTYSCINCIRTFPHLNEWYSKYHDQGLEIIGIHTPEFAFEKKLENVQRELTRLGITFPVVLDNEYGTWRAYANNYWPRKYIINLDGQIVYDHIGEGNYDETEAEIQKWLKTIPGKTASVVESIEVLEEKNMAQSPETYLGSERMERYYPSHSLKPQTKIFTLEKNIPLNTFSLGGEWTIENEKMIAGKNAVLNYRFKANKVFLVMSPGKNISGQVIVKIDGKPIGTANLGGQDIFEHLGKPGYANVDSERLYNLIDLDGQASEHLLTLEFETPGTEAFAFTFG